MSVVTGILGASSHVWSEAQMSRLSGLGTSDVEVWTIANGTRESVSNVSMVLVLNMKPVVYHTNSPMSNSPNLHFWGEAKG